MIKAGVILVLLTSVIIWGALTEADDETHLRESYSTTVNVTEENSDPQWHQQVQIYDMVALPPDDASTYHITVNGLWNGFIGDNLSSPFAFGRLLESIYSGETYDTDEEFVESQHAKGYIVPATILTTQGHESFQGEQLEEFACRDINGDMVLWDSEVNSYWMTSTNPDMIEWCIQHGKKAIDAGADMIVIDEIQGDSLIPMVQWGYSYLGIPPPGFSDSAIEGFRTYLTESFSETELQQRYNIDDIETYDLRSRIASTMNLTYWKRIEADPLNEVYFKYLDDTNFHAKKRLIQELRAYAELTGREIIISANSYALGTNRPGAYWSKGLHFSELVDCFTYENRYFPVGDEILAPFPRNKWVAWEKLARAATGAPAVTLIDTDMFQQIHPIFSPLGIFGFSNYLNILCAEAFANQGTFVNYYIKPLNKERNWEGCRKTWGFVLEHQDLYDAESIIDTPVAILYLYGEGMRTKSDTYLGLAQALAESNIPFEVIFDGDGYYINELLTLEKLTPYEFLLVPSVIDITPTQKNILKQYVQNGGKALVFNPEALDFPQINGEFSYGNGLFYFMLEDKGWEYYYTYNDTLRQEIESVIISYTGRTVTVENASREIVVSPYLQPAEGRMVIHLVNYDHNKFLDSVETKQNIVVSIKKPDFDVDSIYVISPDFKGKTYLTPTFTNTSILFTVPQLTVYDVVVIEKENTDTSSGCIQQPENGFLYVNNRKTVSLPTQDVILAGDLTIIVQIEKEMEQDSKVEFYIDGTWMETKENPPYRFICDKHVPPGLHIVNVVVYNSNNGKSIMTDHRILWKVI